MRYTANKVYLIAWNVKAFTGKKYETISYASILIVTRLKKLTCNLNIIKPDLNLF